MEYDWLKFSTSWRYSTFLKNRVSLVICTGNIPVCWEDLLRVVITSISFTKAA